MSSGLAQMYDLRNENEAKEYLGKLGTEYSFQCFHEKLPEGCQRLADFLEAFRKDYEKAASIYKDNCEKNKYGRSCFKLGHYHMKGQTVDKNVHIAAKYYEMACENNHIPGCYSSGMLYLKGSARKGLFDAKPRGLELLDTGCQGKDTECCHQLSATFLLGRNNCTKDMAKAFNYAMKGCELGHLTSCVNVSQMYRRGDGVKKDEELANEYKERAKKLHKEKKENTVSIEFQNTK